MVSESARRRRAQRHRSGDFGQRRHKRWHQRYRNRIRLGLEHCRACGLVSDLLTFDHVIPWARGGRTEFYNATILCQPCNRLKGNQVGGEWASLVSLFAEENRTGGTRWSVVWEIRTEVNARAPLTVTIGESLR